MNHVRGLIIISYFISILTNFRLIGTNLHLISNMFYVWKGVVGRIAIVDPLLKIVNSSYLCHFSIFSVHREFRLIGTNYQKQTRPD